MLIGRSAWQPIAQGGYRWTTDPAIKAVLVRAVELEQELSIAILLGEHERLEWDAAHDFSTVLISHVVEMKDPSTIPVLIQANWGGSPMSSELSDYGRVA